MSLSTRNQVAKLYTSAVTNDGGYAAPSYTTDGTVYFCRVIEQSIAERLATGQIDGATMATLELSDDVVVPDDSLFVVNGLTYRVRGVTRRPARHLNHWMVEWINNPVALTN